MYWFSYNLHISSICLVMSHNKYKIWKSVEGRHLSTNMSNEGAMIGESDEGFLQIDVSEGVFHGVKQRMNESHSPLLFEWCHGLCWALLIHRNPSSHGYSGSTSHHIPWTSMLSCVTHDARRSWGQYCLSSSAAVALGWHSYLKRFSVIWSLWIYVYIYMMHVYDRDYWQYMHQTLF